jgi:hypothetical protein
MNTEQLKQAALAATPGPWFAMPIGEVSQWVDVVAHDEVGRYSLPFIACKHFDSEANAALIAAANPSTILALLECVDALRALMDDDADLSEGYWCDWSDKARAALQKLEAL